MSLLGLSVVPMNNNSRIQPESGKFSVIKLFWNDFIDKSFICIFGSALCLDQADHCPEQGLVKLSLVLGIAFPAETCSGKH